MQTYSAFNADRSAVSLRACSRDKAKVSQKMNSSSEEQDSSFNHFVELSDLDAGDPLAQYAPR